MSKIPCFFLLLFVSFNISHSNAVDNLSLRSGSDPQMYEGPITIFKVYPDRDIDVKDIYLRYYNGTTTKEYINVKLFDSVKLFDFPTFKKDKPTVIYIHGYKENPSVESVNTIVGAYLSAQPETNVVVVDWSNMAYGSYFLNAAPNTGKVGLAVATQLKKLLDQNLNFENLHVVGHSLGGQIAGFIGREIIKLGVQLKRISALDPAFPVFYPGVLMGHIEKSNADFVDILHTDAGAYGGPSHTGTADFWPNNGIKFQPGCPVGLALPLTPEDLCSHWRSWRYWAESVINPKAFPSIKANSYKDYQNIIANGAENAPIVYMGIDADNSAVGDYYLTTNNVSPYGKGK